MTSLIAMLLSLAMMLTGAGGEAMPAQSARTLTLRNVVVTYNGETQRLTPEAHIGAMTDGESAVFDFGVDVDGQTLLPIQIGVGEKGVTALFGQSGVALNLTKQAVDGAMDQFGGMGGMVTDVQNPELLTFLTREFLPAYAGLMKATADKDFQEAVKVKSEELLDSMVDRGEGTPDVAVIDDVSYDVLTYHYAIDAAHMGELADALFASTPELTAYSDALFKLYSMMPAETGLNELHSFTDLMTKFNIDMNMEIDEKRSEDGQVQVADAVLTLDMNNMVARMNAQMQQAEPLPVEDAEGEPVEGEPVPTPEPIVLEPIVMNMHSVTADGATSANVSFAYEMQGSALELDMNVAQDAASTSMELNGSVSANGEKTGRLTMSSIQAVNEAGGSSYGFSASVVSKDAIQMDISVYGDVSDEGASNNTFSLDGRNPNASFGLSFDVEISADAIEDKANAAEPALVIDDLSDETMSALFQDENNAALLMQIGSSLSADAAKLTQDQSVQNAVALLSGQRLPISVEDEPAPDYDYTYEIEGDDGDFVIEGMDGEGEYEAAEDDGELGFELPELTFLPEGWSIGNVETDTAYDWVGVTVTDAAGAEVMYATFFQDMDGEQASYIVAEDGTVQQSRTMTVNDYGEGGMAATVRQNGIYGNFSFAPDTVDVETIGQIVAGIEY